MRVPAAAAIVSVTLAVLIAFFWQQQKAASETRALQKSVMELARARDQDAERMRALQENSEAASRLQFAAAVAPRLGTPPAQPLDSETTPKPTEPQGDNTEQDSAPVEAVLTNMESSFDTEPADASWASRAATTIQAGVRSLLSEKSTIESIECRSSMCRLRSVQQDLEQYKKFVYEMVHSDACKECFFTQTGESRDGRPILTMYMAREGRNLPRPE